MIEAERPSVNRIFINAQGDFEFLCSGYATDNIIKVLQGDHLGTLFHKDAHLWTSARETCARAMAVAARECSRRLQVVTSCFLQSCKAWGCLVHYKFPRGSIISTVLASFPDTSIYYIARMLLY